MKVSTVIVGVGVVALLLMRKRATEPAYAPIAADAEQTGSGLLGRITRALDRRRPPSGTPPRRAAGSRGA